MAKILPLLFSYKGIPTRNIFLFSINSIHTCPFYFYNYLMLKRKKLTIIKHITLYYYKNYRIFHIFHRFSIEFITTY